MNPSRDELKHMLSRAVPVDMLKDPEFKEILKEKARNTAPSDDSSTSDVTSVPPPRPSRRKTHRERPSLEDIQYRLHKAASQPTRLVNPHDRDMVPQLEHRARAIQQRQTIDPNPPPPRSFKEMLPPWLDWKVCVALGLLLIVSLLLVKRRNMISKLGLSYAIAAEFPFLSGVASMFSGVPSHQMKMQIKRFQATTPFMPPATEKPTVTTSTPPPQTQPKEVEQPENATIKPKQQVDKRKENIRMLIDEAVCYAMEARGEVDFGTEAEKEEEEEEKDEDDVSSEEEEPETKPVKRNKTQTQPPMPRRKAVVKTGVGIKNSIIPEAAPAYIPPPQMPVLSPNRKEEGTIPGVRRESKPVTPPPSGEKKIPGVKRTAPETKDDFTFPAKPKTKIVLDE
jgi:hypothetical protein